MSTEGNRHEEALTSSEQELHLLVEAIPALVWRAAPEGNIEYVNKRVLDYFGAPLGEVIGWGWMDKVHPDDVAFKVRTWLQNLESGNPHDVVCRFRGADGRYRWFEVRGEPLRADDGAVLGWYGVLIDIDDRRRAEEALRESEYKLRQIIETVPSMLWSLGPDGEQTQLNQRALDYIGVRFEDLLHLGGWTKFVHPDDLPETANAFHHSIQTGTSYQAVHRLRRADGEYRWHHARAEPLRDRQGRVIQWYGLTVDIDERKQAEDRLRHSEAYLAEAQRLSHTGSFGWTPSTGELHWSDETFRILEYDPSVKPTIERVLQRIHPDDLAMTRQLIDETSRGEKDFDVTHRLLIPDGSIKFVHVLSHALKDAAGNLEIVGALMDVTENTLLYRDLAEREARLVERTVALCRSEGYLAEAQRLTHIGVAAYNEKAILYGSEEIYRIWGFDPAQGVPSREAVFQRIHPDDRDRMQAEVQRALGEKIRYSIEYRIVLPDGTVKHLQSMGAPEFSAGGELVEIVATQIDVTERKRAEQALRESEAKFKDYAESASDWFWEIDSDYKFTVLTENAFGSNTASRIGTVCWDGALDLETESEKWRLLWATLESRKPFRDFVYRSMGGSGSPMYVKASGKPVFDPNGEFRGYRGSGADVTATMRAREEHKRLRQLESDLAHMNRLSMMGELAASLAHEITQPIATARNNARAALNFLDKQPSDLGEVREALGCVVGDADRAGVIVDRMRDHIKKAPPRKHRFDLNEAIDEVIVLARSAIAENGVSVQTRLKEGLLPVEGDRVQLQQVILNLVLNAAEAMSAVDEGARQLFISTEQGGPNGVLVAVRDSGPGIDPEHIERVFDAFYTTKPSGVGMGLSICRSIIDAHGGRLWADPNEPSGAVFQFTLPGAEGLTNSLHVAHQNRAPHEDSA
jgi:PAS domain S-box-containing protein